MNGTNKRSPCQLNLHHSIQFSPSVLSVRAKWLVTLWMESARLWCQTHRRESDNLTRRCVWMNGGHWGESLEDEWGSKMGNMLVTLLLLCRQQLIGPIKASNPQACLRSPRPAAVIPPPDRSRCAQTHSGRRAPRCLVLRLLRRCDAHLPTCTLSRSDSHIPDWSNEAGRTGRCLCMLMLCHGTMSCRWAS